jgi:hypothetical protein
MKSGPDEVLLVLDGTTGLNMLTQVGGVGGVVGWLRLRKQHPTAGAPA